MTFKVRAIGFWFAAIVLGAAITMAATDFSQAQTRESTVQADTSGWNCGGCGGNGGNGSNGGNGGSRGGCPR